MATILLIAALVLFILDASAKLAAYVGTKTNILKDIGLQSAGLACFIASILVGRFQVFHL